MSSEQKCQYQPLLICRLSLKLRDQGQILYIQINVIKKLATFSHTKLCDSVQVYVVLVILLSLDLCSFVSDFPILNLTTKVLLIKINFMITKG